MQSQDTDQPRSVQLSSGQIDPLWIALDDLKIWASNALADHAPAAGLDIRLCDSTEMRQLNHSFAGKNAPTNVLAFPVDPEVFKQFGHLGDVVICVEVVDKEARAQNKTRSQHCAHMLTHGILHLLGYDHLTEPQAEQMEQEEQRLLKRLGLPNPYLMSHR